MIRIATIISVLAASLATRLLGAAPVERPKAERPNIIWIFVDDMSANFSCYGEKTIATPAVDGMAAAGLRFSRAFVTAPVCSACRSALITGMYQTSIGAQHHRSGQGTLKIYLPDGVEPVPAKFQRAGYYTCIGAAPGAKGMGKTDYNFVWDESMYDGTDWSGRKPGQPFFMQVQLLGGKYRHRKDWKQTVAKEFGTATKPGDVTLPPYYPRDPVILDDWAEYLDTVRYTDRQVQQVLDRLKSEGLMETTYVFFMTDHGISHARGKQFLYDEGIHVPFVVIGPGIKPGQVRDDFVEHIDMTATSLALAGIDIPKSMQGHDLFAADFQPRDAVFSARDRCGETVDRIRAVRTDRFKYICNYYPQRSHMQPSNYKDSKPIVIRLRELHAEGKLDAVQDMIFAPSRPVEELYELASDRYEIHNLATDPAYQSTLVDMRGRLERWMEETNDLGRVPESDAMYDSDMAAEAGHRMPPAFMRNIELMKQWAKEGK